MKKIVLLISILCIPMLGCANSLQNTISLTNHDLEGKYSPYRYIKVGNAYTLLPAGKKGKSIALNSPVLLADIYSTLKENCGFDKSNLIETRVVSYEHPIYYEVWVFNDSLSKRNDQTSSISVLLKQLPNAGGVDLNFIGGCHSLRSNKIVFGE